jgi:hypothetical protein
MWPESAMRKLVLALTILALTAVTAFTAGGALVGSTDPGADPIQKRQIRSGGVAGNPQGGFLHGGYDVIAKSDMSGTGGGGMMGDKTGDMMGSMGMMGR